MSKPSKHNPNETPAETRLAASLATTSLLAAFAVAAFAGESTNQQLPATAMQEKAAQACSTCHESRIIEQQRLSKAAWTKEMDKMIKWGAEVDPKDRDILIDYFSANFGPDQLAYVAPRTPTESNAQVKQKK
jgi:mono/diheme cytochrome c family protein